MPKIDPSARVHPKAELADDVVVGPFAIIGEHVRIGPGTVIDSHCVLTGHTELGAGNHSLPVRLRRHCRRRTSPTAASRRACSSATATTSASS